MLGLGMRVGVVGLDYSVYTSGHSKKVCRLRSTPASEPFQTEGPLACSWWTEVNICCFKWFPKFIKDFCFTNWKSQNFLLNFCSCDFSCLQTLQALLKKTGWCALQLLSVQGTTHYPQVSCLPLASWLSLYKFWSYGHLCLALKSYLRPKKLLCWTVLNRTLVDSYLGPFVHLICDLTRNKGVFAKIKPTSGNEYLQKRKLTKYEEHNN